jgi:hypothetical protein
MCIEMYGDMEKPNAKKRRIYRNKEQNGKIGKGAWKEKGMNELRVGSRLYGSKYFPNSKG